MVEPVKPTKGQWKGVPHFTKENAKELGLKGATNRWHGEDLGKGEDPLAYVRRQLPRLMRDLINAAMGRGKYHDLPSDKRLAALLKAIEYGVGKPIGLDKQQGPEKEPEPEAPLVFE